MVRTNDDQGRGVLVSKIQSRRDVLLMKVDYCISCEYDSKTILRYILRTFERNDGIE